MTLLRLIQRASILVGMTFTSLSIHSTPAHAEPEFCIVASNGKTVCGKTRGIERMCITTNGSNTVCGKFKSAKEGQDQGQETRQPIQGTVARKEVDNIVFALKSCKKLDTNVRCELTITNKGTETGLQLPASSSTFVDAAGKSHRGSTAELGGQGGDYPNLTITPGVDYSASITFENIPDRVVKAQVLNLGFNYKSVQFRNVPFSN